MVVGVKSGCYLLWQIARLLACFVYWNEQGCYLRYIHQQVVYQEFYLALVLLAQYKPQAQAVLRSKRMVAHEGISTATRQIFYSTHLERVIEIVHERTNEVEAVFIIVIGQKIIDFVLMNNFFKI